MDCTWRHVLEQGPWNKWGTFVDVEVFYLLGAFVGIFPVFMAMAQPESCFWERYMHLWPSAASAKGY